MAKVVHKESCEICAKYNHPQSQDFVYYTVRTQISDANKTPFTMTLKMSEDSSSFAEPPPEAHTIKAPNIIELKLKLDRWFAKYGFTIKHTCKDE